VTTANKPVPADFEPYSTSYETLIYAPTVLSYPQSMYSLDNAYDAYLCLGTLLPMTTIQL